MDTALALLALLVVVVIVVVAAARVVAVVTVHDYERGLRFRQGRLAGLTGPGSHVAIRGLSEIRTLDARPTLLTVEGQEVMTSDGVPVKVSLAARYVVADPVAAFTRDASYFRTLYTLLQLGLRDVLAGRSLDEALATRREIGPAVREAALARLTELGIELLEVEVRDLMVPGELKRAFAGVIAARKEGEAALEKARAETAALRALANAGRQLDDNPGLLQLRILQEIGGSTGNTVVFGAPDGVAVRPAVPGPGRATGRGPRAGGEPGDGGAR